MWQRRAFLRAAGTAFAAGLLPRQAEAIETGELVFATATQESSDRYGARLLTETGKLVANIDLPVRGHDVSYSPIAGRAVVFARRPGTLAVVFDPTGQDAPLTITTPEGRHFFGHGTFSTDGRLLYATENDFANGRGVIGIYDVVGGYHRIGEFPTYGVGPHEMLLMPDGKTLAIANGGIETHPDYGRAELNLDDMDPCISFVDARDGSLIGQLRLDAGLRKLSIRHMVVDASDRVWFGCQFRGDRTERPQLIGYATLRGDIRLIELASETINGLGNYVGGLAVSRDRTVIAASSPVGGTVLTLDTATARPLSQITLPYTCGVAEDRSGFIASNGLGQLESIGPSSIPPQRFDFLFDEHLRLIG